MKLSLEDKVEIVRLHEKDGLGYGSIARKYKVRDSVIQSIYYRYKIHGYKSLIHPQNEKSIQQNLK